MKNEQSLIFANGVIREFIPGYIDQSSETIKAIKNNKDTIMKMIIGIFECQISGGKILIGGNGGSCADAEHFAGEMTCTFKDPNRSAFNAISLTNNASATTTHRSHWNATTKNVITNNNLLGYVAQNVEEQNNG